MSTNNEQPDKKGSGKIKAKRVSSQRLDRIATLTPRYKESAKHLLDLCKSRGPQSYEKVQAKSDALHKAETAVMAYNASIKDAIKLNVPLTKESGALIVCELRHRHGLPRLKGKVSSLAIEELYNHFIMKASTIEVHGVKTRVHTPLFALLP